MEYCIEIYGILIRISDMPPPLRCGDSGVCSTLGSCVGGGDGSCVTAMLKVAANDFSAAVCFYLSCRMGLDGDEFWRASMRSSDACVNASAGERLGNLS